MSGVVPHPRSGGYPIPGLGGCTPSQVWGVPHLRVGVPRVPPSSRPGWGTPTWPDLGWGTPPGQTWDGVPPPPHQTWDGVAPLPRPEMGYPPPSSRCGLTHKVKILPSPILRMRAVMNDFMKNNFVVWHDCYNFKGLCSDRVILTLMLENGSQTYSKRPCCCWCGRRLSVWIGLKYSNFM